MAIICRNTTEAINHLAYRLRLEPDDVVVTTVVEHHANLLPWARLCRRRFVECGPDGTFDLDSVVDALAQRPRPRLLAVTGASNVSGWLPPIEGIIEAAHEHDVPVLVDAAQLAAHRSLPRSADYLAWSGHKMYAPFGAGILVGPTATFREGDPFLAGGGAVDLVDLDEVVWTDPPDREEAGSPNVLGAVALHAAIDELEAIGWPAIAAHDRKLATRLRSGLANIDNVRAPRSRPRHRHPAVGRVQRRRRAPRSGGRPTQRRVRHRGSPWMLLRPSLLDTPARVEFVGDRRLPLRCAARGPPPSPRGDTRQRRD